MLASVSVDLDSLACYAAIFGLERAPLDDRARRAIPALALERFGELFESLGLKGTFFAVGRDYESDAAAVGALQAAARAGHEIASHSFSHDYALARRPPAEIADDLARAKALLERTVGAAFRGGFRAPGYTLTPALLEALVATGHAYDSSLLASPAYYLAKAAAVTGMRLAGRVSRSILGPPAQLFASPRPHRRGGLPELPIAVVPGVRLPFYGTLVVSAPEALSAALARTLRGPHLNFELHGIDLVDESDGIPKALAAAQRDARIPVRVKRARLSAVLRALAERAEFVTLADAAERLVPAA